MRNKVRSLAMSLSGAALLVLAVASVSEAWVVLDAWNEWG